MVTGNNNEGELPSNGQELLGGEEKEQPEEEVELVPWQREGVYFLRNRPMRMPVGGNVATGMRS